MKRIGDIYLSVAVGLVLFALLATLAFLAGCTFWAAAWIWSVIA